MCERWKSAWTCAFIFFIRHEPISSFQWTRKAKSISFGAFSCCHFSNCVHSRIFITFRTAQTTMTITTDELVIKHNIHIYCTMYIYLYIYVRLLFLCTFSPKHCVTNKIAKQRRSIEYFKWVSEIIAIMIIIKTKCIKIQLDCSTQKIGKTKIQQNIFKLNKICWDHLLLLLLFFNFTENVKILVQSTV